VIAIDVSLADETEFHNYGDYLNGFYAQLQALLPWNKGVSRILNAQEIQVLLNLFTNLNDPILLKDRLAFISSVRQLELVKKAPYCNYCRPPIDEFLTLDFAKFDIIRVGNLSIF
jgi:lysophospholipid hydrolase